MSYDLYFFQPSDSGLDREALSDYLSDNLTAKDEEFAEWNLENERTGVHYQYEFDDLAAAESASDEEGSLPVFTGNVFTGLVLHVNFGRPDFFGLEAFQFVDKMVRDLGLSVFDPQATGDVNRLTQPSQAELSDRWSGANVQATETFRDYSPDAFTCVPAERSNALWRYNSQIDKVQNQLGDDIFVPSAFFLKPQHGGSVFTAATWVQGIGQLVPPVDLFAVVRKRKRLFRSPATETGLISREAIMAAFGKYLREFHVEGCSILYPKQAEALTKEFSALKFEHNLDEFVRLGGAELTNVPESLSDDEKT